MHNLPHLQVPVVSHLGAVVNFVAGTVGVMLSRLFYAAGAVDAARFERLRLLDVSFGEGLQLVNIIKDCYGDFSRGRFSRVHHWHFDGGITLRVSASPQVVPLPFASREAVDPEEALVAAASSCHMMTFMHLASKQGFVVDRYADPATRFAHRGPRLAVDGHGTGCTLSSAIAARIARGEAPADACRAAIDYVHAAMRAAYRPGRGDVSVLGHLAPRMR